MQDLILLLIQDFLFIFLFDQAVCVERQVQDDIRVLPGTESRAGLLFKGGWEKSHSGRDIDVRDQQTRQAPPIHTGGRGGNC
jgi:hypothetical protein